MGPATETNDEDEGGILQTLGDALNSLNPLAAADPDDAAEDVADAQVEAEEAQQKADEAAAKAETEGTAEA